MVTDTQISGKPHRARGSAGGWAGEGPTGPREQFAAAVGAAAAHLLAARGAEGAFIAADAGVAVLGKGPVAALAGGAHFKHG